MKSARCLTASAALLDDSRFEEWLDLFQEQCVYWILQWCNAPESGTNDHLGRYRTGGAWEDKIARFRTGFAFSQLPPHPYPPLP